MHDLEPADTPRKEIRAWVVKRRLSPLVKAVMSESKKGSLLMSGPTIARIALQMQQLLDEWGSATRR